MREQLKKYFSIFYLLLFLFPFVEQQLHAFEHKDDVHCFSSDKHFHELEHECSICDFNLTHSNTLPEKAFQFILAEQSFLFSPFIESVNTVNTFQYLPTRAPPVVA